MTISVVVPQNEGISIVLGDDKVTIRQPDAPEASPSTTGQDGRSAYESAVKNGYTGTEAQWVASLKGEPGDSVIEDPGDLTITLLNAMI
jgi:hypothetical protein